MGITHGAVCYVATVDGILHECDASVAGGVVGGVDAPTPNVGICHPILHRVIQKVPKFQ